MDGLDDASSADGHKQRFRAGGDGAHVYFECDDLDARVAALNAKSVDFDSGPEDKSWLWREAWLRDPAGNRLCLYFAGDNRRFPPWRLEK